MQLSPSERSERQQDQREGKESDFHFLMSLVTKKDTTMSPTNA